MNQWDLEDDHDYDEEGEDSDREYLHVDQLKKSTTPKRKTRMGSSDARKADHNNNKRYPKNLASSAEVYSDYDDDLDVEILPPSTHGREKLTDRNVEEISIDELREAFDDVAGGTGGAVDKM